MGRPRKRLIDGSPIAALKLEAHIAGRVLPDLGSAFVKRILERNGREHLIVHSEQLSSVLRLVERLRNDQRDAVAHMAHEICRQHGPQRAVDNVLLPEQPGNPDTAGP